MISLLARIPIYWRHWHNWRYEIGKRRERLASWFIWKLPPWVIYRCTIRAGAYASTGVYGDQVVPDLTLMDTLQRWHDDMNPMR